LHFPTFVIGAIYIMSCWSPLTFLFLDDNEGPKKSKIEVEEESNRESSGPFGGSRRVRVFFINKILLFFFIKKNCIHV
jgi:hypothetical protein